MRQATLFFLFVGLAISQCNEQSGTLTGTGSGASLDNTSNRCTSWSLTITTNGPIARYSTALQGDFGSGFVDLTTPSNPCTTITRCTVTYSGPFPNALRENTTIFTSVPIGGSLTYTITGANANPPAPPNSITINGTVCTLGSSCTVTSGTTVSALTPYISIAGIKYVAQTMFPFTALFSGSFLDTNTFTTTASANGDVQANFTPGGPANAWYSTTATTSVEAEFSMGYSNSSGNFSGIWICDSTNNNIWVLEITSNNGLQSFSSALASCNPGTPGAFSNVQTYAAQTPTTLQHFKLSVSGGTLTFAVSLNGGKTFTIVRTQSVGTISKAGIVMRSGGANSVFQITDWLSVVIN